MKKLLAPIVKRSSILYKLYLWLFMDRKQSKNLDLIYKQSDINAEYYNKIKNLNDKELEHQIGRLTNFKEIIKNCQNMEGDFIEFGTWKGFSLLWIAYFMERNAIFKKKLVGLDGFVGLPYAEGIFDKFAFSNSSLKLCRKNLLENNSLYDLTRKNILIEKFLYKQKGPILQFLKRNKISKFCFIHIDCDVSESAKEIFEILLKGKLIADECYVLFDDYGCQTKLKNTVDNIFNKMGESWNIKVHSYTNLTKNFILKKITRQN